ncbi:hypothetical protein U0070_022374 [Myodes glareolus]|uniref:Uncharacterized protein n=1 Tax=Myodes glareolus TaxID=447135 RepID=A0AAW0HEL2_MYOGA
MQPLAPTPTRWLSCGQAAPGSRSGVSGDTNLALRGSETEARRSLRSPTCLLKTRSRDPGGLNASRLPQPLQSRGDAESWGRAAVVRGGAGKRGKNTSGNQTVSAWLRPPV